MNFLTIVLISIALAMDSFAVSISCGIKIRDIAIKTFLKISFYFGLFQALMPLIGWSLGYLLKDYVELYANWIAFAVFMFLGLKTIKGFFVKQEEEKVCSCDCKNWSCLISLALATSIDAFIIGVLFSLFNVSLLLSVTLIGTITFVIVLAGCFIGSTASSLMGKWAELVAAFILIGLAFKVLY